MKTVAGIWAAFLLLVGLVSTVYSQPAEISAVFGTVNLVGQGARLYFTNLNQGDDVSLRAHLKIFDMAGTVLAEEEQVVGEGAMTYLDWFPPSPQQVRALVVAVAEGAAAQPDLFVTNLEVLRSKKGPGDLSIYPINVNMQSNVEEAKAYAAVAIDSAKKAEAAADRAEDAAAKAEACSMR